MKHGAWILDENTIFVAGIKDRSLYMRETPKLEFCKLKITENIEEQTLSISFAFMPMSYQLSPSHAILEPDATFIENRSVYIFYAPSHANIGSFWEYNIGKHLRK